MIINDMSTLSTTVYSRLMANPLISKASLTGVDLEVYTTPTIPSNQLLKNYYRLTKHL